MFENRFEGQVAVVMGGASGIGKAVALRLAREGARVVIADPDETALNAALEEFGGESSLPLDITDETQVREGLARVANEHGKLDILFNSAGIPGATGTKITDYDTSTYEKVVRVNQLGSFLVTKYALLHMQEQNYGRVRRLIRLLSSP